MKRTEGDLQLQAGRDGGPQSRDLGGTWKPRKGAQKQILLKMNLDMTAILADVFIVTL